MPYSNYSRLWRIRAMAPGIADDLTLLTPP